MYATGVLVFGSVCFTAIILLFVSILIDRAIAWVYDNMERDVYCSAFLRKIWSEVDGEEPLVSVLIIFMIIIASFLWPLSLFLGVVTGVLFIIRHRIQKNRGVS